jgi:Domain of unknown function (DUF3784)
VIYSFELLFLAAVSFLLAYFIGARKYTWLLSGYNQRRIRDQEKLARIVGKYNMIVGIAAAAGSMIDHPDMIVIFPIAVIGHVALAAYANVKMVE